MGAKIRLNASTVPLLNFFNIASLADMAGSASEETEGICETIEGKKAISTLLEESIFSFDEHTYTYS